MTHSLLLALAIGCATASAQITPATIRQVNNDLANQAASGIEVFAAANTVATGEFYYDYQGDNDLEFSTYKLPYTHTFGDATNTLRPFIEGHVGYFDLEQDVSILGPPKGSLNIESLTATLGGGVDWHANDWLTVSPRFLVSYCHIWEKFRRIAPPGDPFANLLVDWEADGLTLLPALNINGTWSFGRWDLSLNSRYTYIRLFGIDDNSSFIDLNSDSHVWRNEIGGGYRSPWTLCKLPLRFFGLFARHDLFGEANEALIDRFYEFRLGVGFATPTFKHVREVSLSGAYYFHDEFNGYDIGLSIDF